MATQHQQRQAALAVANFTRSARAALKRQIAKGGVDVAELIAGERDDEAQEIAEGIPIGQLLEAYPGIGPVTAEELLATPLLREPPAAAIPSDRPLHRLTPRTRRELAARTREETR